MDLTKDIMMAIKAYIERSDTMYAIMIDGDWGCGKTYLWKNMICPMVGKDEALYVSLFGLKNIEEIENEIFKAMSFAGGREGFFSGILNKSTVDITDEIKLGGIGCLVQFGMQKWKEINVTKSKKLFICFDDLERWVGDISICLSYINKLVEHDGTKCLIIGNASRITGDNKNKFNLTKDKTIGFKYILMHEPSDVFNAAFCLSHLPNKKASGFLKKTYENNAARIDSCLRESKCSNIRIVSTALSYLGKIIAKNYDKFTLSETTSVDYFISILSTVILVEMYRTTDEDKDLILSPDGNKITELIEILGVKGYGSNDDKKLTDIDIISENLLYQASNNFKGIRSIVKNGFYKDDDFTEEFLDWKQAEGYEAYLDTFKIWYMDDSEAKTVYDNTYKATFIDKTIRNPNTLIAIAGRMTLDVKRGVLDLDFETLKNDFRALFEELYENDTIEHVERLRSSYGQNNFEYCGDLFHEITELNKKHHEQKNQFESSQLWINLKIDPSRMDELLGKYLVIEVFEQYKNPEEVLQSIESLTNSQLFEFTRWMGDMVRGKLNSPSSNTKILAVVNAIEKKYGAKYGVKAGHFKQIARILKNNKTVYDPDYHETILAADEEENQGTNLQE